VKKKVFIIAEAGVNHNNKINLAYKLVDAAKKSGADAVKFQVFKTENYISKNAPLAKYQKKNSKNSNQFEMIKKLELPEINLKKIILYCKNKKIIFLASPFDLWGVDFLIKNKIKTIKIPSGEINNFPYLKKIAKTKKKVILSSGMSNLNEVSKAIKILLLNGLKKNQITVLQCNSEYPTPANDLNLNVIKTFKSKFHCDVGLSDHSRGIFAPVIAVSLGATTIEKHLTLSNNLNGPDHKASLNPIEFKSMVEQIRFAEIALGSSEKKITKSERKNITIARKSIFASKRIKIGDRFTEKNLCLKRPAKGIQAENFYKILGKKSKKNYKFDQLISHNEL
tara:strand:- start:466 stop:1479 length:1014 start_codon:yes stop_codon:yes gene_type:complete